MLRLAGLAGSALAAVLGITFLHCASTTSADDLSADASDEGGDPNWEAGFRDGACSPRCSSDLHSVLDCNGNVVMTCPADQGCGGGACVSACDSAKANKSTVGCEYFTFSPDSYEPGGCFAAYVANTWGSDMTITVDRGGSAFPVAPFARIPSGSGSSLTYAPLPGGVLPAGQVAILFLSGSDHPNTDNGYVPPCPKGIVPPVASGDPTGTKNAKAFHIVTDHPSVAYDIWPYGGGDSAVTSATLLMPTSAWDTNYVAVDAYDNKLAGIGISNTFVHPWVALVGSENGTSVSLTPTGAILAISGVPAAPVGVKQTYTLDRGQVITLLTDGELSGSPIQSSKPIGVFGGMDCMDVPDSVQACDSGHQQIPPVKALGHEYVVARYRDRYDHVEWPPVRLVGAVKGTTLSYDPAPPSDAPATIDQGQMVEFRATRPFVVRSQDDLHPFYVASYMTGCSAVAPNGSVGAADDCRGDPEFVNVIPAQEYLSQYTFFTDPTYPETELVVIRARNGPFADVTLDCLGSITSWEPVDMAGNYQVARVDLVTGNFQKVGKCDNGRHEMHSTAPFGVTVWGWGSAVTGGTFADPSAPGFYSQAVSYAYPAGASVLPITSVVVPVN